MNNYKRIKHIHITKEGEPMANPEMDYPGDINPSTSTVNDVNQFNKYHSGLLPFEDGDGIRMILGHQSKTFEESQEWKFKPDTLIPVDLNIEIVTDKDGLRLIRII